MQILVCLNALYRGCEHPCRYYDSRSPCYGIENFRDVLVKINVIDLLFKKLVSKKVNGVVFSITTTDDALARKVEPNARALGEML